MSEKNKFNFNGDREDIVKILKNYGNSFEHPFSIFVAFESTLQTIQQEEIILDNEEELKTKKLQEHIPNSCGIKYLYITVYMKNSLNQ